MCRLSLQALVISFAAGGCGHAQVTSVEFAVDEDRRLVLAVPADESPRSFGPLSHSVEMACAVPREELFFVFVTDGDNAVFQYATDLEEFRLLRTIPVNPDTDACALDAGGTFVYLLDPATGIWRSAVDPESEIALEPVAMFPPWGRLEPETGVIPAWIIEAASREAAGDDAPHLIRLSPQIETTPVDVGGDAADDPAIVVNPRNRAASLILGTDKTGGLRVYDLAGQQLQYLDVGRLNNVDVVTPDTDGSVMAVAAATNRTHRRIDFFEIDLQTSIVTATHSWPLEFEDPYGLCMYFDERIKVIVGDSEGRVQHWAFRSDANGVSGELLADLSFRTQTEGCDVDVRNGIAWIGEEDAGVWRVPLRDPDARDLVFPVDGAILLADVEGIAYVVERDGRRRLIVSSQGDNTLVVYDLDTQSVDLKATVGMNWAAGIDGVSETDGLDVVTTALPGFPGGLLVMQDGRNVAPPQTQNFKLIGWAQIDAATP